MKNTLLHQAAKFKLQNRKHKRWQKAVSILACIVVFCTVYALILPALTAEGTPHCGIEEHTHTDECYENRLICGKEEGEGAHTHTDECYTQEQTLICGLEEGEGAHTHTEECYDEEGNLICGLEENEGHQHTEECYQTENILTCDQEESAGHQHTAECYERVLTCGKEEHTHTLACYSDPNADVEDADTWQNSVSSVSLTGNWGSDLAAIAQTQIGYRESTSNYNVAEDGATMNGYTRYGAWAGDPYRDNWSAQFTDFCLSYAGIPSSAMVQPSDCWEWAPVSKEGYTPNTGDLIILDGNQDGTPDHAGIVLNANDAQVTTVIGDSDKEVKQNTYNLDNAIIVGYVTMPRNPNFDYGDAEPAADDADAQEPDNNNIEETPTAEPEETPEPAQAAEEENEDDAPEALDDETSFAGVTGKDGDEITVYAGEYDFTKDITNVSAKYKVKGEGDWLDLPGDKTIDKDDSVQFNMEYTLPKGSLTNGNKVIKYPLPNSLKGFSGSGYVSAGSGGAHAGTYKIENGEIVITFNDEYAQKNETSDFVGWLSFDGKANEIKTGDNGKTDITFKESVTVDLTIKDNVNEKGDIKVSKSDNVDYVNGLIKYTVEVSSSQGTWDNVTLEDIMTNVQLDPTQKMILTKPDGSTKEITVTNLTKFTLTLDKMNPGDKYTLVYYAKVPDTDFTQGKDAINNVSVKSKNNHEKEISDKAEVKTEFKDLLKSGVDNGDGTISWTVAINPRKKAIGGWKLSDEITINGVTTELENKTVHIEPAIGGTNEITLPYTFSEGTAGTYTVTYTTKAAQNNNTINKAIMTPPDGSGEKGWEDTRYQWAGENKQLKKTGTGVEKDDATNTLTLKWKVTINPQKDIDGEWTFKDELQDAQWFTEQQYNDIVAKWNAKLGANNYTIQKIMSSDNKCIGYEIKSSEKWTKGERFELEYSSTADAPENETMYNNKAYFKDGEVTGNNNYKPVEPPKPVTPVVRKVDPDNKDGGDTSHDYYTQNGLIKWQIEVSGFERKDNAYGTLEIIENLPDGVTLDSLNVYGEGCFNTVTFNLQEVENAAPKNSWRWGPGLYDALNGDYIVSVKKSGEAIVVSIPKELIPQSDKKIVVDVIVKINDEGVTWTPDAAGNSDLASFKNSVSVKDIDEKEFGEDSQTQTIVKLRNHDIIGKKANIRQENNIPYEITINPEGKDLVEGSDELTLVDEMVYNTNSSKVKMSLVPGSFKVTNANTGEKLSTDQYSMKYEEVMDDSKGTCTNRMTITIPDKTPLKIEYEYNASGETGTSTGNIQNTATLTGIAGDNKDSSYVNGFEITKSSAGVVATGLTLYKVDSERSDKFLKGAQFQLYKWAKNEAGTYEWVIDITNSDLISNEKGMVSMPQLTEGVAYKLEEIKAPAGYEISTEMKDGYFFYIAKEPTEKPENVSKWNVFQSGEYIYYPNTKSDKYELPETGGIGTNRFTAVGLALMAGSLMCGYVMRRKRRERREI